MRAGQLGGRASAQCNTICGFKPFSVGICAFFLIALADGPPAHAAGGAFQVDDAEIGSVGECKVESWTSFAGNGNFIGAVTPACVIDFGRPMEIGTTFARFREGGEWGTELVFKGKANLIPIETNKIGVAIIAGGAADLVGKNINAAFVTIPVSFQVHEQLRLNVNAGWLGNPTTNQHAASWGASAVWNFVKQAAVIGEVFGFAGGENPQPRFQLGLRYTPQEFYDIDVIYGRNLTGEHANWITVGINLRFDAPGASGKNGK